MRNSLRQIVFIAIGLLFALSPLFAAKDEGAFAKPEIRRQAQQQLSSAARSRKADALLFAQSHDTAARGSTPAGQTFELRGLLSGRLLFNVTANENVAVTGAVDAVRDVAGPEALTGTGMSLGIWDSGAVLGTHQEFNAGIPNRAIAREFIGVSAHATQVAGTLAAAGVDPVAKGMAPSAYLHSWDWTSDVAEMATVAAATPDGAGKLLVSNHSYAVIAGWSGTTWHGTWGLDEDETFGQYNMFVVDWDRVAYGAPYYLPFVAAGNDRNDDAPALGQAFTYFDNGWKTAIYDPAIHPPSDGWDQGGYDTLQSFGAAKNVMTVGAIEEGITNGVRDLAAVEMTSFSGWGPADDGRVKPDIVVNGRRVLTSDADSATAYDKVSGTSIATPGAAGAGLLLQEHYLRTLGRGAMRSSTLKALMIHAADDLGAPGPDYAYGWGLLNAKAAVDLIDAHAESPEADIIREVDLANGATFETSVVAYEAGEVAATLVWTDPEGPAIAGLNSRAPVLVNDLDLRLVAPDGTEHRPFVLDAEHPSLAAATGDNLVDNVEQVRLAEAPAGIYTLRVGHKGALHAGVQTFSLVVSAPPPVTTTGSTKPRGLEHPLPEEMLKTRW